MDRDRHQSISDSQVDFTMLKTFPLNYFIWFRCPCGPPDFDIGVRRVATRKCIGDFINGAKWGDPDDSQCSEFSPAGRKLCQLASVSQFVHTHTHETLTDTYGRISLSFTQ